MKSITYFLRFIDRLINRLTCFVLFLFQCVWRLRFAAYAWLRRVAESRDANIENFHYGVDVGAACIRRGLTPDVVQCETEEKVAL